MPRYEGQHDRGAYGTILTQAAPSAGAESVFTVPTYTRLYVYAVAIQLVTSAGAANRSVALVIDDGTNELIAAQAGVVQTASLTWTYFIAGGPQATAIAATRLQLAAPFPMPIDNYTATWRIRTSTANIQVGDQWGIMRVWCDRMKPAISAFN